MSVLPEACEIRNKLAPGPALLVLACAVLIASAAGAAAEAPAAPQPHQPGATAPRVEAPALDEAKAEHESIWGLVGRITNFAILAGTLVYFLRAPLAKYLQDRGQQIRQGLVDARTLRATAAGQLEEIDRRMKTLPGELEALTAQGAREVAAEQARIRAAADAERERLLEQTRREIDLQLRIARRALVGEAADLTVRLAGDRIRQRVTADDQLRLVDRYLDQVRRVEGPR